MSSPSVKPAFVAAALGAVLLLVGLGVVGLGGTAALVAALHDADPAPAPASATDGPAPAVTPAPAAAPAPTPASGGLFGAAPVVEGGADTAELVAVAEDTGGPKTGSATAKGKGKSKAKSKSKSKAAKAGKAKGKASKAENRVGKRGKAKAGGGPETPDPTPAPAPKPAQKECKPDSPDVEQTGERSWKVKESFVDRHTKDLDAAEKLAKVGWARGADGDIIGFKIRSLPCKSPLREAGFMKGDVITSVNGKEITSVASAMRVGLEVRRAGQMRVRLTRKGVRREHTYTLVK